MKYMLIIYASEADENAMKPADIQGCLLYTSPSPRDS